MKIKGKTALVLGSSKGIGKAIGMALIESGARVIFTYYDWPDESEKLKREVKDLVGDHCVIKVDLRDKSQVRDLIADIEKRFGELHILINNIERGGMPVVHGSYDRQVNHEQWELELDTTLKAKWLVFHQALPLMKKSGAGAVVTLSSIAGLIGRSGPAGLLFNDGYAAANRAVGLLTETWARQAAPQVRVNELMLGFVETRHAEGTRGWGLLNAGQKQALVDHTPLARTGTLDEVSKAVFFLIEDATFMTGSVLRLDGGYILGGDRVMPMPDGVL